MTGVVAVPMQMTTNVQPTGYGKMTALAILFALSQMATSSGFAGTRAWTDITGRKVEAGYGGTRQGKVVFLMPDGKEMEVPMDRLSEADRAYVRDQENSAKPPDSVKPESPQAATRAARSIARGDGPAAVSTWPSKVDIGPAPEVEVVNEDKSAGEYIYRTAHFDFHSDIRLSLSIVREFSRVFEATYQLNCLLPLDYAPKYEDGSTRFKARIFEKKDDYVKAGAPQASGGLYKSDQKSIFVPLSSLGVINRGSRVTVNYEFRDYSTLTHEVTHQMMNRWLRHLPVWYIEAAAVYAEMIPYRNGLYDLSKPKEMIRDYLGGGRDSPIIDPAKIMTMDYKQWSAALVSGQAGINYHSVGLLAFYFFHLDGDGDGANIIKCLRGLEQGRRWADLEKEFLLRGRTMEQFRDDLMKEFKEKMHVTLVIK